MHRQLRGDRICASYQSEVAIAIQRRQTPVDSRKIRAKLARISDGKQTFDHLTQNRQYRS